jgi:hypothetical protein
MNDGCIFIVPQALECLIENHMLTCEEGNGSPKLFLLNTFSCTLPFNCGELMLPDFQYLLLMC